MKKQIGMAIVLAAVAFAAGGKQTFTGVITDSMCDNADHKDMKMGPDAKCVTECIKTMDAKYVLFDGKTAYVLSDQKTPEQFAAKKVKITGTLDPKTKTIQVDRITPAN
ncbi:MAG TPA: hypothetical protein VKV15_08285 [Bryobacteraceae bacterium]|nr:hypothetical protein [Bryobacteraceae bacterium]